MPVAHMLPPPPTSLHSIPLIMEVHTATPSTTFPVASVHVSVASTTHPLWSIPSLAALLATPLPAGSDPGAMPKAAPLIISPALAPISAKVVEKAHSRALVDFKEFLVDNTLLVQRLQELGQAGSIPIASEPLISNSRMREVSDPLMWALCFLAFMAARTSHDETRDLAAYGMVVLQLARKHGGSGWLLYDRQFRLQQAAGASLPWVEINSSLMAATVLGQSNERSTRPCNLCLAADHSREDCALASLEAAKPVTTTSLPIRGVPSHRHSRHSAPYKASGICYRYNSGSCYTASCRFEHSCSGCFSPGHPEIRCPDKGKGKGRSQSETRLPGQPPKPSQADKPRQ